MFPGPDGETVTFDVGTVVETDFKTSLLQINYRYSFINNGKTESGIVVGLSLYNFDIELHGIGAVDDGTGPVVGEIGTGVDLTAPVPSAGFFIRHAFTPKFLIKIQAQFFELDYQDLSGRLTEGGVVVEYYPWEHVGFGGGWQTADISASDQGANPWKVEYRYGGLLGYVSGVF